MHISQKYSDESDNESSDNMDSSFVLSESDSSSCKDFDSNDNKDDTKSTAFLVFWLSLIILIGKCFTCFDKSVKITRKVHGSFLIIMIICSNGHKKIWGSQPSSNRQSLGNILIYSVTLFSGNTFQRIYDFFPPCGVIVYWKDQVLPISETILGWCCPIKVLLRKQINIKPIERTRFVSSKRRQKV